VTFLEHMAKSAMRDAVSASRDREYAASKKIDYDTRLFFDSMAARAEQRIIDKANLIIERSAA
jgi:hypothetical protein